MRASTARVIVAYWQSLEPHAGPRNYGERIKLQSLIATAQSENTLEEAFASLGLPSPWADDQAPYRVVRTVATAGAPPEVISQLSV